MRRPEVAKKELHTAVLSRLRCSRGRLDLAYSRDRGRLDHRLQCTQARPLLLHHCRLERAEPLQQLALRAERALHLPRDVVGPCRVEVAAEPLHRLTQSSHTQGRHAQGCRVSSALGAAAAPGAAAQQALGADERSFEALDSLLTLGQPHAESAHLCVERRTQRVERARRARLVLGAATHVLLVEPAQLVAQLGLLGTKRGVLLSQQCTQLLPLLARRLVELTPRRTHLQLPPHRGAEAQQCIGAGAQ
eukprot:scaffold31763_cov63-Phaeocystis_antarctica.AAC.1